VTTPGGVPNLPVGALTIGTLATVLQDTSHEAMKGRAAERFPSTFDGTTGGSPAVELSPTGVITSLFAGFNSTIARADPADIDGPEDLPGQLLGFIEDLPVIGQFVELLEAIAGTYTGDDEVLLTIQTIFAPIREIVELVSDTVGAGVSDVIDGWNALTGSIADALGVGQNAQGTANDAWSAILAMRAILSGLSVGTGTSGSDNFDGPSNSSLSPKYTELVWGAAANHYKLSGAGRAVFNTSGFIGNNVINLDADPAHVFVGNAQTTGVYLPLKIIPAGTALILITNFSWSTTKEAACVYVTNNTVQAGYLTWTGTGFTLNTLGTAASYAQADGEYWQFDYGDVAGGMVTNPNMYRVFRNGNEVLSYDDSSSPHITLDADHVSVAWGGISAAGFPAALPAPQVDSFAFWERA
jgi:hypothetical protein